MSGRLHPVDARLLSVLAAWTGLWIGPGPLRAQDGAAAAAPCVTCHLDQADERLVAPARDFPQDIHAERGFGCLACHGKMEGERPDPAVGFLAKPQRQDIPEMCASCHSDAAFMRQYNPSVRVDQLTEYRSSVHGQLLFNDDDPAVAVCTSCHTPHRIRPPGDPTSSVHPLNVADLCGSCHADAAVMEPRGHSTNELEEYKNGIHGQLLYESGDLSAPTCNDCHGNHGAAPPGVESVRNVCGECHVQMAELFRDNGHPEWFSRQQLPGCAACHSNHDIQAPHDDLLLETSREVCAQCHTAAESVGREFEMIHGILGTFEEDVAAAQLRLEEAETLGMEVAQAQFELESVNTALTLARTAVHSFRVEPVQAELDKGGAMVKAALGRGDDALEEHHLRRLGLGVSASLMALVVFLLILRIRGIDTRLRGIVQETRAFFGQHILDSAGGAGDFREQGEAMAAHALLYELAREDRRFAEVLDHLRAHVAESGARLPLSALYDLIDQQHRDAMDAGQFARLAARHLDPVQKVRVINALRVLLGGSAALQTHEPRVLEEIMERLALSPGALQDQHAAATATPPGGDSIGGNRGMEP